MRSATLAGVPKYGETVAENCNAIIADSQSQSDSISLGYPVGVSNEGRKTITPYPCPSF